MNNQSDIEVIQDTLVFGLRPYYVPACIRNFVYHLLNSWPLKSIISLFARGSTYETPPITPATVIIPPAPITEDVVPAPPTYTAPTYPPPLYPGHAMPTTRSMRGVRWSPTFREAALDHVHLSSLTRHRPAALQVLLGDYASFIVDWFPPFLHVFMKSLTNEWTE
ncbi:hypothetical protein FRB99_000383 [Tulasnella sp. 403]|nr:hypothetical protein FRB99_000383 [Tulasnella sp. 403]